TSVRLLAKAGRDHKAMLKQFLATPPTKVSCLNKADALNDYLAIKREEAPGVLIDLSGFDLSDVYCKGGFSTTISEYVNFSDYGRLNSKGTYSYVDFSNTRLSKENVEAIIANNGDLTGATL